MKPPVDYYGRDELPAESLRRVILVPRLENKWLFLRDENGLYALPETVIAPGETADNAAARCLSSFSDSAALFFVCLFRAEDCGALFYAELKTEPTDSAAVLLPSIPSALSEPRCTPFHFEWAQWRLSMQSSADELWDVYDKDRTPTGRTHRRGTPLPTGDYHLVVHVWIRNPDGSILLTRRAPNKGHPLLWECSGGSALAGDDSRAAALREVFEETGLTLEPESGTILLTDTREGFICDVWLFRQDVSRCTLRLQPNETVGYRFVSKAELIALNASSELVPYVYFDELLKYL